MRRVVSHSKKVRTYIMDETKQDMNIEIGKRLQGLREKKNLSQASFIKEMELRGIDITRSTYSRYECGGTPIPLFYVKEFCDYFGVTTDYFINGTEIVPDKQITQALNLTTPEEKKAIHRFITAIAKCTEVYL